MIVIARLHSNNNPDVTWDYIVENHEAMNERLRDDVRLLYMTRRGRHNDVSLFMHVNDIDAMGQFIADEVAQIEDVDDVWIINLFNSRFFPVPKETLPDLSRFTITIQVYPSLLKEIHDALCTTPSTPEFAVMYIANTFHLYGVSIMVSVLAKHKRNVRSFISKRIKTIPGVLRTHAYGILKTHRLLPREEWEKYAHIFPEHETPRT